MLYFWGCIMLKLFRDGKIWTIPNLMSFFRLLLVPFIIWAYVGRQDTALTILLLAVSALTDVMDGQIARHFNMVSDLGKALDPVADKMTQVCVVLCLAFRFPLLWILLGLCVLRESTMAILGYITIRKTNKVPGARWFGKVSTVVLYTTALALLIFPKMPDWLTTLLIALCIAAVVMALILYVRYFTGLWKQAEEKKSSSLS